ncbi:outer membrane beta-barrel protein [Pedobacter foliorum]|uniref:outer membrane beta-barrel protein n=1 Tax=Pedobacter foliorum TaxID=2739058 RepID=UPI0015642A9F|nr:outer membrane beta-barrel protein [Pedobacter foliorum]NRF38750.1 outer membrane beta-barrel protein [Pedobacter foliorum]
MRNSGWNHKLWKKKLNELPVEIDLNSAWSEMQSILDHNLPLSDLPKSDGLAKTIGNKIVSMLGYILPAAAMIAGLIYFTTKQPKAEKSINAKQINKNSLLKTPDILKVNDSAKDSNQPKDSLSSHTAFSIKINQNTLHSSHSEKDITEDQAVLTQASSANPNSTEAIKTLPDLSNQQITSSIDHAGFNSNVSLFTNRNVGFFNINTRMINLSAYNKRSEKDERIYKKTKRKKSVKIKEQKEIYTPQYNYSFEAGLNVYQSNQNIFLGANAAYAINKRLIVNAGLRLSLANVVEGSYTHPSYNLKDSAKKEDLTILDHRQLTTADIPLGLEYKISNRVSIKAGPVLSFLIKNGGMGSKLGTVKNLFDTVYNSKKINNSLANSTTNKLNIGFSTGLSVRFKQFNIEAGYRQNFVPYKVSSDLGSYKKDFKTFQIGIGYNIK